MSQVKNPFEMSLQRIFDMTDFKTTSELQKYLGISRQAFSQAKRKYAMPNRWALQFKEDYGLNPEWILNGKGEPRMKDFHDQLALKVYIIRDAIMSIQHDIERYGTRTKAAKAAATMASHLESLRSDLDEYAFKECPDMEKDERLKIYYHGKLREQIDFSAIVQKGSILLPKTEAEEVARLDTQQIDTPSVDYNFTSETGKPIFLEIKKHLGPVSKKVFAAEQTQLELDADASEHDILDAVIPALVRKRNSLERFSNPTARESEHSSLVHEYSTEYDDSSPPKVDARQTKDNDQT